jgi:hypothetical protein
MPLSSRIVAVIVLVAVGVAFASAQASDHSIPQPKLPPCHGHMPEQPSRAPVSYQCCVNGHHAAIPRATFQARPLVALFSKSDGGENSSLASVLAAHFSMIVTPSSSPPGIAPLRI